MQARLFSVVVPFSIVTACCAGAEHAAVMGDGSATESGSGTDAADTTDHADGDTGDAGDTEGAGDTDDGGDTGSADPFECEGQLEPRNDREILLCNALGERVIASVARPQAAPPPGGWPGVIVLHGSGGLFFSAGEFGDDEDEQQGDEPCTEVLEHQFHDWAERLTERGYAVVMPASFYSRGFCEWGDDNRPDDIDKHESLIRRTFDAAAAADYLCADPQVDCSRLAVLGFSAGATVTVLFMHEQLLDAHDPRLHDLDAREVVGAIAYYPGCGLEGEIINELDEAAVERYYFPRAPMWVPHAEKDSLLDDCEEIRDPQVDVVAQQHGIDQDMFEIEVYPDAKHGFDGSSEDDKQADFEASMEAQAKTLVKLHAWF